LQRNRCECFFLGSCRCVQPVQEKRTQTRQNGDESPRFGSHTPPNPPDSLSEVDRRAHSVWSIDRLYGCDRRIPTLCDRHCMVCSRHCLA